MTRSGTLTRIADGAGGRCPGRRVLVRRDRRAERRSPDAAAAPPPHTGRRGDGCAAAAGKKTYKDMTVGFIQTGSESGWRAANTASFKETAAQLGVNLKFYDAQNKLENQVSAFHRSTRIRRSTSSSSRRST